MLQNKSPTISGKPFLEFILVLTGFSLVLFFIYSPGLGGGFVLDDISNILMPGGIRMQELSWHEINRAAHSMDSRPLSRASFGLNFLFSGFNPYYFKLVNLCIHLLNSLLVFYIIKAICNRLLENKENVNAPYWSATTLALLVSVAWAVHPINLTSVLYTVQRMNSLSALFVLAGMLLYIQGRLLLGRRSKKSFTLMAAAVLVFGTLAWFSKENGAILPVFLFITELTIFRFQTENKLQKISLYVFFIIVLLIPVMIALIYIFQHPDLITSGYNNRYFSLQERLLTESRILWSYIQMILIPLPSSFGLFQDDVIISKGLLQPTTTLISITGLTGLLALAFYSIRKLPYLSFGILIFLSGHVIESTILPLELKYDHRNYLPSIGIIFPLFTILLSIGKTPKHYRLALAGSVVLILMYSAVTYTRVHDWSNNSRLYLTEVQYHPNSPRANYEAGKYYGQLIEQRIGDMNKNYRMATDYFSKEIALRENSTSGLFGIILVSIDSGHSVKQKWIEELQLRLRSHPLEQVNIVWLDSLTDCVVTEKCDTDQLRLNQLIDAALANKYNSHQNRIMLYSIRAKYDYNVNNNINAALVSAREAERIAARNLPDNPVYKISLIKYLIRANNIQEARDLLEIVHNHENSNIYDKEIAALNKELQRYNLP